MADRSIKKADYSAWLGELKSRIQSARIAAARWVNRELILLYWDIGRGIVENQERLGWGKSVVEQLSRDLKAEFPGMTGFSPRNLWDMRRMVESYSKPAPLAQVVRELGTARTNPILQRAVAELENRRTSPGQPSAEVKKPDGTEVLRQLVADTLGRVRPSNRCQPMLSE